MSYGTVYLLHFSRPFKHARHYLGWTAAEDVEARLDRHRRGDGARLVRAAINAGITFELARVWENGGRFLERKLKKRKNAPALCPICRRDRGASYTARKDAIRHASS